MVELLKKTISTKQLLINNDFQINQRGQSEYVNTINQYTVDMWLGRSNSDISVVANGISLKRNGTYGTLVQLLMDDLESKTVTMVVKVNGNIYSQTVKDIANNVNSEKWIVDNVIGFALTKISNKYAIALFNHSIIPTIFEYVDLFEGDTAYPHVKEDYMVALYGCQEYEFCPRSNDTIAFSLTTVNRELLTMQIKLPFQMKGNKSVIIDSTKFIGAITFPQTGKIYNIKNIYIAHADLGLVYIELTEPIVSSITSFGYMNTRFISIITCAPI